jgi:MFS family permease
MLAGNAVFPITSIECGAATDGMLLLIARVVQGVGAAFMVTGAIALVAGVFRRSPLKTAGQVRRSSSTGVQWPL